MKSLEVYTDGGARGNPGPAAYGLVVTTGSCHQPEETIYETAAAIGRATNNEAEYQGLIAALEWLNKAGLKVKEINIYLDSRLVVKQMQGDFKVKADNLKPLWHKAVKLADNLSAKIKYSHIPRDKNAAPDKLLNQALDKKS